jgi:hypothetical protein
MEDEIYLSAYGFTVEYYQNSIKGKTEAGKMTPLFFSSTPPLRFALPGDRDLCPSIRETFLAPNNVAESHSPG